MKRFLIAAAVAGTTLTTAALAADVGVSFRCRRVLECRQLRDHRYKHGIPGEHSRAHQRHHEHHRNRYLR